MPRVDVAQLGLLLTLLEVKQSYPAQQPWSFSPSPPPNGSSLALIPHTPRIVAALPRASDWISGQALRYPPR